MKAKTDIYLRGKSDIEGKELRITCESNEPCFMGIDGPDYGWANKVAHIRIGNIKLSVPLCERHFKELKEGLEGQ